LVMAVKLYLPKKITPAHSGGNRDTNSWFLPG
jgi:hypothetical protein